MSHKFFPSILLACVLFALPASAQTGDASRNAAATAVNNADGLTPDQAKRALDTLSDDKMRARMIETLRAIATASPQASAAPESQSAIPLTADSLGAQLLLTVSGQIGDISGEIADLARTLTHFTAFYYWIVRTANDPAAYDQLLDIAWKLALVFSGAFVAEWVVFRLIQRPVAFLEAHLPQTAQAPARTVAVNYGPADPPSDATDVVAEDVILLSGQGGGGGRSEEYSQQPVSQPRGSAPSRTPAAAAQQDDQFGSQGITDDDVPF